MTKSRRTPQVKGPVKHCWQFFQCSPERQAECLIVSHGDPRCWRLNVACCKMPADAPRPLSIKKIICLHCEFYKTFKDQ